MADLYSTGQRSSGSRGRKKRSPWLWMVQEQAAQGQATTDVMNKMQAKEDEAARREANRQWKADYNLGVMGQRAQDKAAGKAAGMSAATLGINIMDKFGGKGSFGGGGFETKGTGGRTGWGGSFGGALGGAALGYGIGGAIGSGSKKNKTAGAILGGLAGWFF